MTKYRAVSVWFPIEDVVGKEMSRDRIEKILRDGGFGDIVTASGCDAVRMVEFVHVLDMSGKQEWLPEFQGGCAPVESVPFETFEKWAHAAKAS